MAIRVVDCVHVAIIVCAFGRVGELALVLFGHVLVHFAIFFNVLHIVGRRR